MEEFKFLKERIKRLEIHLEQLGQENPDVKRLMTIPGVGPLSATALVASLGDIRQFNSGQDLSAWLGLVPRQHSTGGNPRLLGISKRGNLYLRTLLIHGARAVIRWILRREKPRSFLEEWCLDLIERRGITRPTVALANKMGRMVWALLVKEEEYKVQVIG